MATLPSSKNGLVILLSFDTTFMPSASPDVKPAACRLRPTNRRYAIALGRRMQGTFSHEELFRTMDCALTLFTSGAICAKKEVKINLTKIPGSGGCKLNDGDAGAEARREWIKTNQGVAFCIAGVSVALLVYLGFSEWAFRELRDGFRLGFFTAVAVFAMLLCALAMMVDHRRQETEDDMGRARWQDWAIAATAMVLCYVYFQLAWEVDFLLVTPFFIAGATYVLGIRPLRSAAMAGVIITVVIFGLFRLLGIELPTRIIDF